MNTIEARSLIVIGDSGDAPGSDRVIVPERGATT
jgi:hypothetical protein